MPENCSSLEPWVYRATFPDGLWMSDAFIRDTEALTRALQTSIASSSSSSLPTITPSPLPCAKQERPTCDPDSGSMRTAVVVTGPTRKVSKWKKKSRASKRSPTTFITADPANFRHMVQQVTGVTLGDEAMPVTDVVRARPASQSSTVGSRSSRVVIPHSCLPTLDTSAFLLSSESPPSAVKTEDPSHDQQQNQQIIQAAPAGVGRFDFDAAAASFQCVPTLESWGVM